MTKYPTKRRDLSKSSFDLFEKERVNRRTIVHVSICRWQTSERKIVGPAGPCFRPGFCIYVHAIDISASSIRGRHSAKRIHNLT